MVSFCDIPLSLAKDHIKTYGSYGIGMMKEWGIKNNLNPVVYIERDSLLAKDIQATIDNMMKIQKPILSPCQKKYFSHTKDSTKSTRKGKNPSKECRPRIHSLGY